MSKENWLYVQGLLAGILGVAALIKAGRDPHFYDLGLGLFVGCLAFIGWLVKSSLDAADKK